MRRKVDEAFLEKAAGNRPLDLFIKRTVAAPYVSEITAIEDAKGKRCGQLISLRFIAYGKLETVIKTDVIKELIGGKEKPERGPGNKVRQLTVEELTRREIRMLDTPKSKENYGTTSFSLLDKIQIEGVNHGQRTTLPNAVIYATRMDDRFQNDKEYPNRWRAILAADEEKTGAGPPLYWDGRIRHCHSFARTEGRFAGRDAIPLPRGSGLVWRAESPALEAPGRHSGELFAGSAVS